ncbi:MULTISPECIES: 4-hydroxy-tetrahydrodipicolinate reductase [unclassified Sphaerochaeta]|jgi:4-hydroxy-tetrahydrodipicolinate reductase|uniref:4-hydroxy-tetrahydrodipicolinate reductase n=1 Tax=unclassified Sphaerochaeta TaxID=2637943 RepID=UPI0025EB3C8B|nr:4-hydroxy-tetrahydrodipicolinate reductase [Sphaerochaeta sp. UBA5856]
MHIAIVGFGKMGRQLHEAAITSGHDVVSIIDPYVVDSRVTHRTLTAQALAGADAAIEFSVAEGIEERMKLYCDTSTPAVIATTGWYDKLDSLKELESLPGCAIIWSGNFSIGVQLFFSIVRKAASLMNNFPEYDSLVQEWFHAAKADSPSGTAVMLGNILTQQLDAKDKLETARLDRRREKHEIHISSVRGGYSPGVHTVLFDSPVDTIELTHTARNSEGFVSGALKAAAWIVAKKQGFFSIDDMLDDVYLSVEKNV